MANGSNAPFLLKIKVDVGASLEGVQNDIQDLLNNKVPESAKQLKVTINKQSLTDSINKTLQNYAYSDLNVRLSGQSTEILQRSINKAITSMPQVDRTVDVFAKTDRLEAQVRDALSRVQKESLDLDVADGGVANLQSSIQTAFKRALKAPDIVVPTVDTDKITKQISEALKKFDGYALRIRPIVGAPTTDTGKRGNSGGSDGSGGSGGSGDQNYARISASLSREDARFKTLNSILKTDIYKGLDVDPDELERVEKLRGYATDLLTTIQAFPKDTKTGQWLVDEQTVGVAEEFVRTVKELDNAQKKVITGAKILQKPDKDTLSFEKYQLETLRQYDALMNSLETRAETPKRSGYVAQLREAFSIYEKSGKTAEDVQALAKATRDVEIGLRNVGAMGQTAGEKLEYMLGTKIGYAVLTAGLMAIRRSLRQLYTNVLDLDSAMTELKKVTNETDEAYDRFLLDASHRAHDLGASLVEIVNATADAARLGLDMESASALADAAVVYNNVGDGLANIDEASASIISTMQAFGVEASDSMSIVDKFNEVANKFAISSGGIGDAMLNSASALESANNTLDESIAMITATNEVIQDPQKVGGHMRPAA